MHREITRRRVLRLLPVAGAGSLAGCVGGGSDGGTGTFTDGTETWSEAFEAALSDDELALLAETPITIERVSSQADVETAVAVYGWVVAVDDLPDAVLVELEELSAVAAESQQYIDQSRTSLSDVIEVIDLMKDTSALGQSVWDVATLKVPQLQGFDIVVRELHDLLEELSRRIEALNEPTQAVLRGIREIRTDRTTAYGTFPDDVNAVVEESGAYVDALDDVLEVLDEVVAVAADVTAMAEELPALSEEVGGVFEATEATLRNLRRELTALRETIQAYRQPLIDARETAEATATENFEEIAATVGASGGDAVRVDDIDTDVSAYEGP